VSAPLDRSRAAWKPKAEFLVHRIVALIDGVSVASTDHVHCPRDCHNVVASMRTRPAS
jgi:hypothetical protein